MGKATKDHVKKWGAGPCRIRFANAPLPLQAFHQLREQDR